MRVTACLIALFVFLISLNSFSMILPKNNLNLQDTGETANITEEQFNFIVDHIVDIWKPYAKVHGGNLTAVKDWNDSTVNAYADQKGNNWEVHFFGGLARRPEVTPDGFALVVCHELGHHFGGYAFYDSFRWASSEGEADYFATQVCARKIWGQATNGNAMHLREEATTVQQLCQKAWGENQAAEALCSRVADAGISLATLLNVVGGGGKAPRVDTPDTSTVSRTNTRHPAAQCRLDTYLQGALCVEKFDLNVIPGRSPSGGQTGRAAETEAAKYSCTRARNFTLGVRPLCWYRPLITSFEDYYNN